MTELVVTDKRRIDAEPVVAGPAAPQPPAHWDELVAVDAEMRRAQAKHGDFIKQGNTFGLFGNPFYAHAAAEMKRQNDARSAAGEPGLWTKIILEELYEAFELDPLAQPTETYAELIQAAAMALAAAYDLRSKLG